MLTKLLSLRSAAVFTLIALSFWSGSSLAAEIPDEAFPIPLHMYNDAEAPLLDKLMGRIEADPFNLVALIIFLMAIAHTFMASRLMDMSHKVQHDYIAKRIASGEAGKDNQDVSFLGKLLHFLGEVEAIFGIWVLVLMAAIFSFRGWETVVFYVNTKVIYIEPMFVVVIMTIAATRPILNFAENLLRQAAKIGKETTAAWWFSILTVAPILGSFITEPAAMTIAALLLAKQFYRLKPSNTFKYGTLGLLFVNISVGGTLTNFAAPPVLMVAAPWEWTTGFMFANFGWKAIVGIMIANVLYYFFFKKEFKQLDKFNNDHKQGDIEVTAEDHTDHVPFWVTFVHMLFLLWTVVNAHYPVLFIGGFLFFLGFKEMTPQHQNKLELKTAILVGFFLAGLVNHGGVQGWWIAPVLASLTEVPLMVSATVLTAFNDNAAITYLSTLVPGLTDSLKYAVVAGAVTGGGLTVIANAPNPAGQSILAKFFANRTVSPISLATAAIVPTVIMGLCFMIL
ncbi:MAG: putative Na+/H+ antiporter [Pseudobacteriovorax sp.]|nr:putative Na+/H+ antiporter [Pseudobacteriovorax sp.]